MKISLLIYQRVQLHSLSGLCVDHCHFFYFSCLLQRLLRSVFYRYCSTICIIFYLFFGRAGTRIVLHKSMFLTRPFCHADFTCISADGHALPSVQASRHRTQQRYSANTCPGLLNGYAERREGQAFGKEDRSSSQSQLSPTAWFALQASILLLSTPRLCLPCPRCPLAGSSCSFSYIPGKPGSIALLPRSLPEDLSTSSVSSSFYIQSRLKDIFFSCKLHKPTKTTMVFIVII